MRLNLEATTKEQQMIKAYLEANASEILAEKINNGVRIQKDGKTFLNKKTLAGFLKFACDEAKKQAEKGTHFACIEDAVVYGWAVHYFEEDSIEEALYNMDGTIYKAPMSKTAPIPTKYEPPKPKPKPQMSIFDMMATDEQKQPIEEPDDEPTDEDYAEAEEAVQAPPTSEQPQGSPVWQRYIKLGQDYPNHIAVMRLGDFYEVFGENACTLAKELPLTLTGRDVGLSERVPMIGFPYHASQNYFQKMVGFGHHLAVMDSKDNIFTLPQENIDPETGEILGDLSEEEMREFDGDIEETIPTVSKILAEGTPTVRSDEILAKEITDAIGEDENELDISAFDPEAVAILSEIFGDELELR